MIPLCFTVPCFVADCIPVWNSIFTGSLGTFIRMLMRCLLNCFQMYCFEKKLKFTVDALKSCDFGEGSDLN